MKSGLACILVALFCWIMPDWLRIVLALVGLLSMLSAEWGATFIRWAAEIMATRRGGDDDR